MSAYWFSQFSAEGLVQQRLFQLVKRGEFALVDGFETLGFDGKSIEFLCDLLLQFERRKWNLIRLYVAQVNMRMSLR